MATRCAVMLDPSRSRGILNSSRSTPNGGTDGGSRTERERGRSDKQLCGRKSEKTLHSDWDDGGKADSNARRE